MAKHDFKVKSMVKCSIPGCKLFIKQNLIDRQPKADKCFGHYMELVRKNIFYKNGRRIQHPKMQ